MRDDPQEAEPDHRIRARHERRLKNLAKRRKEVEADAADSLAAIDLELVETKAVLAQLTK